MPTIILQSNKMILHFLLKVNLTALIESLQQMMVIEKRM